MTSWVPVHPAVLCGGLLFFLSRFLLMLAHSILLIYELARGPWDDFASGVMIATLFTVVAFIFMVVVHPSQERSELSQARIALAWSVAQSTVMTGLLIAYVMARPRVNLAVVYSLHLGVFYAMLGFNCHRYHKLRLAPPNSFLHIPADAWSTGDMDRIRAARPDYTKKSRSRKTTSGAKGRECGEGGEDVEAGGEKPSQAPARPWASVTSEGDVLNGPSGGDERRWWEKW